MEKFIWRNRSDYTKINVSKSGKRLSFCQRDKDALAKFGCKSFTKEKFVKTMAKYASFKNETWSNHVFNWWKSKGVIVKLKVK